MSELADALRDLKEDEVYSLVEEKISQGISPLEIIEECNQGMEAVGKLFSSNDYFISQLIYSAEIPKTVMKKLESILENTQRADSRASGTIQVTLCAAIVG